MYLGSQEHFVLYYLPNQPGVQCHNECGSVCTWKSIFQKSELFPLCKVRNGSNVPWGENPHSQLLVKSSRHIYFKKGIVLAGFLIPLYFRVSPCCMMPHSPISFQLLVKSLLIVIYDTPSFLMIFAWLTWKRGNGSTNTTRGREWYGRLGLIIIWGSIFSSS